MMIPEPTPEQGEQLQAYARLLVEQNRVLNLISRNTEADVWDRHIRHCMSLGARAFPDGSQVVDWGTGGGLPLVPLAILFPQVTFVGIDATRKKILALDTILSRLGQTNVDTWWGRADEWDGTAHYSVSRATAPLVDLWRWHRRVVQPLASGAVDPMATWRPGLVCLKGGTLSEEFRRLKMAEPRIEVEQSELTPDGYDQKVVVHAWMPD